MRTWQPDAERSNSDRGDLALFAIESIRDALGCLPVEVGQPIAEALSDLETAEEVLHADIFGWYFSLARCLIEGNTEAAVREASTWRRVVAGARASRARARANEPLLGIAVDYAASDQGEQALQRAVLAKRRSTGLDAGISATAQLTVAELANISASITLLGRVWPEIFKEICGVLQRIYFFESKDFISFTDFDTHGAVFIRRDFISDPCRLAEEILHESSHIHLNTILAVEALFLNGPEERYASPLRADPRPMFGVFHQMYVLSRLSHFYGLMADHDVYFRKARDYRSQLAEATQVVRTYARLTPGGSQLVNSIAATLDARIATAARPNNGTRGIMVRTPGDETIREDLEFDRQ